MHHLISAASAAVFFATAAAAAGSLADLSCFSCACLRFVFDREECAKYAVVKGRCYVNLNLSCWRRKPPDCDIRCEKIENLDRNVQRLKRPLQKITLVNRESFTWSKNCLQLGEGMKKSRKRYLLYRTHRKSSLTHCPSDCLAAYDAVTTTHSRKWAGP